MKFDARVSKFPLTALSQFDSEHVKINNKFMSIDGKPVLPVMGELHYSRVPEDRWDEELKKMKAGGIDIVSSYVFWIHHEEERGVFDFSGNRNVRRFVELCYENGLEFCLRIGPWVHGECRNGGFPDWLLELCGKDVRCCNEPFFSCVAELIKKVGKQLSGMRFFAIQVENEYYRYNFPYYESLVRLCRENGMDAPIFTATGWGNAIIPPSLLPMSGGYPAEPWAAGAEPELPSKNFFFGDNRSGGAIGSDLDGVSFTETISYVGKTPFFMCELGAGNQVAYRRRPFLNAKDIEALPLCKLGSGCNLLGYFMYHGGMNPIGKTTMQESLATNYPNDYPVISYDFQAPLGDNGQIRESYYRLKQVHDFVHAFGTQLAPMDAYYPDIMPRDRYDTDTVRAALRSDTECGFLFVCNHVRFSTRPAYKNTVFDIAFADRTLSICLDIPSDCSFVLPVGLRFGTLRTDYVTAMPTGISENSVTFTRIEGLDPIAALPDGRVIPLQTGENVIDGVTFILAEPYVYTPTPLKPVAVTETENTVPADLLLSHLNLPDLTTEYRVCWEKGTTYLVIYAAGNLAGFFINGKLVNDAYLFNQVGALSAFVVDVRPYDVTEGVLKIQPYTDANEGTICFDAPMPKGKISPQVFTASENVLHI